VRIKAKYPNENVFCVKHTIECPKGEGAFGLSASADFLVEGRNSRLRSKAKREGHTEAEINNMPMRYTATKLNPL